MPRAFGFLASLIAVAGGCTALVRWLDTEDVATWVIAVVIMAISALMNFLHSYLAVRYAGRVEMSDSWWRLVLLTGAIVGVLFLENPVVILVLAALIFLVSAAPLVRDLYAIDKASRKPCPECCEYVKAMASVCHYCGHRWEAVPPVARNVRPD
jgi:lipid-A-disaccharide synthase-like uncharacterized protein